MNLPTYDEVVVTSDTSCNSYNCCVWDLETGSIFETFDDGNSSPNCLAAVENDYIICSIKGTNILKIWPGMENSQAEGIDIICPDMVLALDVSCSGTYCVGAMDHRLYLWQISTGKLVSILSIHVGEIRKVKFTRDEKYIISSAVDSTVIVWKIPNIFDAEKSSIKVKPFRLWRFPPDGARDFSMACFNSENRVIVITNVMCEMYSVESGECLLTFKARNDSLFTAVAADVLGNLLFIGKIDGCVLQLEPNFFPKEELHRKADYGPVKTLPLHKLLVTCLATSKDGRFLLSGSCDKTVVVWNISTSQIVHVLSHDGTISNVFFIPRPSPYSNISQKIIKPFQFELSSCDVKILEIPVKPLDKSEVEKAEELEAEGPKHKRLTRQQLLEKECKNELMFAYINMDTVD